MSNPFRELAYKVRFPVVAISRAGWTKTAAEMQDFTDASPDDDLTEWQGLEIFDSAGMHFVARRAFRGWPRSALGALICRLVNNAIHVAFELDEGTPISVEALRQRLVAAGEFDADFRTDATSHREIIDAD